MSPRYLPRGAVVPRSIRGHPPSGQHLGYDRNSSALRHQQPSIFATASVDARSRPSPMSVVTAARFIGTGRTTAVHLWQYWPLDMVHEFQWSWGRIKHRDKLEAYATRGITIGELIRLAEGIDHDCYALPVEFGPDGVKKMQACWNTEW